MAGLLVSVRDATEARLAWEAGASLIDVKEPLRGSLGRADAEVWAEVRAALPAQVPMSVALGELDEDCTDLPPDALGAIDFVKLGLSWAGPDWRDRCRARRLDLGDPPGWVAVIYMDADRARAPAALEVVDEALATDAIGVLFDTWHKPLRAGWDDHLSAAFERARAGGLMIALAGGLDEAGIERLAPLRPDWFAVRGSACLGGSRLGPIDPERVARLALLARSIPRPYPQASWTRSTNALT